MNELLIILLVLNFVHGFGTWKLYIISGNKGWHSFIPIYNIFILYIMNLSKFISFPVFLLSLAIGLFLVYLSSPNTKNIYVYPTPENIDKFIWQDGACNCYGWEAKEVKKPNNIKNIKTIPIQN